MSISLSAYFVGIGAKRISEVEIKPETSNQHEFNGITDFRYLLGSDKKEFIGKFFYFGNGEEDSIVDSGNLTWYDARERHPKRTEYRLYYFLKPRSNYLLDFISLYQ